MGSSVILPAPGQPKEGPDPDFVSASQALLTTWTLKGVEPPSPIYVTRDDTLVMEVWNSLANLQVTCSYRFLDALTGQVIVGPLIAFPGATRALQNFSTTLGEGFLLAVQVGHPNVGPRRGQTFVVVALERGFPNSSFGSTTLIADYLTENVPLGWPGARQESSIEGPGFIRNIVVANPAAGADIVNTVPANARWRPIAFQYALTTSATVATRTSQVVLADNLGNAFFQNTQGATQAASLTVVYNWSTLTNITPVVLGQTLNTFPPGVFLEAGWQINTVTNAIQAGDQYSGIRLQVEEWIET